jgi:pimeloyl-ACP methyl ester carboxylesterase
MRVLEGAGRAVGSFTIVLGGLLLVDAWFGASDGWWLLWIALGLLGGSVAGRPRLVWLAIAASFLFFPAAIAAGLADSLGPFWYLQALFGAVLAGSGFLLGSTTGWARRPWRVGRDAWGASGRVRRRVMIGSVALIVAGLGGYTVYAGIRGSSTLLHPDRSTNCQTPRQAYGWAYEAINYDLADDAALAAANPDWRHCVGQGSPAGTAVVTRDGVDVDGWYIPAADGRGPSAPTILIVHGWSGNKSSMLPYAPPLHDEFNLVFVDLRDSGRSSDTDVTLGLREQLDVEAMVDWLEATKHPAWIGAVGNSMGGATVLGSAASDQRIRAVLLESTHASIVTSGGNIIENDHGFPAQPAGWATITFASLRVGSDLTALDPARTISRLGKRPVLIIHGTADRTDPPRQSAEVNLQAALAAGVPATLAYCDGGTHGKSVETCPEEWGRWARAFFEDASAG